jgi:tetratricopeptide (TPR) repeat protein
MPAERRSPWPLVLALLATLAVYVRALSGELVYDDLQMIARNPGLRSLSGIPALFGQGYWDFLGAENAGYSGYWRPLTATVLALAHAVGDGRTEVFHGACILVHLLATWAAWALAWRILRSGTAAFFTALLFGLHPVHVESVAWITALNDPLFGLFGLLALLAFVRWRERGSRGVPLVAAACLALALLAKELALAILPMLLAVDLLRARSGDRDLTPDRRFLVRIVAPARAYGAFVVVLLGYYAARVAVFGEWTGGLERTTTYFGVSAARLALLRVELLGGGLGLLAWPVGLNVFRPFHPSLALTHPAVLGAAAALLVWAALLMLALRKRRRDEVLALIFAAAGIVPILGRVASLGRFPLSDRFLYLPVLGFALYLSARVPRLLPRAAAQGALAVVAGLFAFGTWQRIGVWQNEETLFRSALAADARSPYAHWGLGRVLLQSYQRTGDKRYLAEAFTVYEAAQDLVQEALDHRDDTDVFVSGADVLQVNLGYGWCLVFEAQFDEYHDFDTPIAIFDQALQRIYSIRANADAARAAGIAVLSEPLEVEQVHVARGTALMLAGRPDEAEQAFRTALAENLDYAEAHYNYGALLMRIGDVERARHHFERAHALRGEPRDALALAQALVDGGWIDRAEPLARELHGRDPAEPEAMMVLEAVCERRSDWSGALRWLDLVLDVAPQHGRAWFRRALVLIKLQETQGAIEAFRRAVELLPDDFGVRYNFAATLLANGAATAAIPHAVEAYRLCRDENAYLQLRELLRGLPVGPEDAAALAVIDRARRQPESALEWVNRALALAPGTGQALLTRGRILLDLGRNGDAQLALQAACDALPGSFVPRFELGAFYATLGRADEALAMLREARELGPPKAWAEQERTAAAQALDEMIRQLAETGAFVGPMPGGPGGG